MTFPRSRGPELLESRLQFVTQGAHFDCKPFEDALAKWVEDQPMLDPNIGQHCRVSCYCMSVLFHMLMITYTLLICNKTNYTTSVLRHNCPGAACYCDYTHYHSVISRPSTKHGAFSSVACTGGCPCYFCCADVFSSSQLGQWLYLQRR